MTDIIAVAAGRRKADTVFKNANIVDVFNRRIICGDVAVCGEKIAGIGNYSGNREIDLDGAYIMPGFIDAHLHIESSMITPAEYARAVVPCGVTSAVCDPHEIANVCGIEGVKFMMDNSRGLPLDLHFMLPSCVPATDFEDAGAVFTAEDTENFMRSYPFHGLAEMMNYPAVIAGDEAVLRKIAAADFTDGHAPLVSGRDLCAYAASGIRTDHECTNTEEMLEKISNGMYIFMREGTIARDVDALSEGVTPANLRRVAFCTDDICLEDILSHGTISNCIIRAVSKGLDPIDAITAATLNAAECHRLRNVGAIAPGYFANLVISNDIIPSEIQAVYYHGQPVAKDGEAIFDPPAPTRSKAVLKTVHIGKITPEMLDAEFKTDTPVIEVSAGSILTKKMFCESDSRLSRLAVIERHKNTEKIGLGFVSGYNIKGGAIASTIGHDSHNITVIGDNTDDMAAAVSVLRPHGGISVCADGGMMYLPLPIAGLMSDKPAAEVAQKHRELRHMAEKLGITEGVDPFLCLAFLSLPVIPELRLTDRGLFDVTQFKFIN